MWLKGLGLLELCMVSPSLVSAFVLVQLSLAVGIARTCSHTIVCMGEVVLQGMLLVRVGRRGQSRSRTLVA